MNKIVFYKSILILIRPIYGSVTIYIQRDDDISRYYRPSNSSLGRIQTLADSKKYRVRIGLNIDHFKIVITEV